MADAGPSTRATPRQRPRSESESDVVSAVYAEQIATVFGQMPIALVVNLVNAAFVTAVLTPLAPRLLPPLWFGVVGVITFGRAALWLRYRRADRAANPSWWSKRATVGSLLAGLAWGLGGAVMLALVPPMAQLFLTMVIGGMCTGAVVLSASHLPTLLAFLLPACLPVAGRFIAEGTPTDGALGAMILVFAGAMTLAGTYLNRIFADAMRLRFALNEVNRRLQAEMAEHHATEAALRQAQKLEAIGHLTGGIVHDFNNLLTIVIGNLAMAKERMSENAAIAPLIENAAQAAERGVALIQRLLGFARKQRLDPRPIDVGQLVFRMKEMMVSTLGPQIRLVIDVGPDIGPAEIDANQLELAILNLAINARDAMPDGGTLWITVADRQVDAAAPQELAGDRYVVVKIVDTGIGMDEPTLAQAFDPFFTTKEFGVGTGLGLSSVQGFVAQSGGAVRLSSQPGAGTTVELWLPRTDRAPTEASTSSAGQSAVASDATGS